MINTFNLNEVFYKTFGYQPQQIEVKDSEVMNKRMVDSQYYPYYGTDANGREVFMPMKLGGVSLPYVWMSVSSAKTIVETELTDESAGTVFEDVYLQPWKFSVKGLFVGQNGRFPEKDIETLSRLYVRREAVEVQSVLTDIHLLSTQHKDDKVIIMDYNLAENPGVEHVRGFTMELQSTREFSLFIQ